MPALKLDLGCGEKKQKGFIGVDIDAAPGVDQVVDLNVLPWPWGESSVDEIYTSDCLEHLAPLGRAEGQGNIVAVLREVYRVLKPGAQIDIYVPSTDSRAAWQDPTHVTYWNKNTFLYFTTNIAFASFTKYSYGYPRFDTKLLENLDGDLMCMWVHAILEKPEGT